MCIFISYPVSQFCSTFVMRILKMSRNSCLIVSHIFKCSIHRKICSIALWCRCNIGDCLCKYNTCFRHTKPLYCLCRRNCYRQCIRICIPHILRRRNHNPSGNEFDIFPRIEHFCKIVYRRIRIRPTQAFDKSRNSIVMIVSGLIITNNSLLNTFLCHV